MPIDVREYNRRAWDQQVTDANRWTRAVPAATVEAARRGDWEIVLTPTRPVPRAWFPPLDGARVLCLASGGGQQGPVLAAAGARVTVYDNSPNQLAQDRAVADRDGLPIGTVEGDMRDLGIFENASFDLVVHPCANGFVPDILPVWREAARVTRPGGVLLAGFCNPLLYIFDDARAEAGELVARFSLPYSDLTSRSDAERDAMMARGEPASFSHSLEEQIGGQLDAGFALTALYEDGWNDDSAYGTLPLFVATRSVRL